MQRSMLEFMAKPEEPRPKASMDSKFDVQFDMDRTLFVLMDFETTGPNVYKDRVCQIGACVWVPGAEGIAAHDSFKACMNPQYPMSLGAYNTHQIEPHRYMRSPEFSVVLRQWQAWIAAHIDARTPDADRLVLCAHNGNTFDFKLLVAEMLRHGVVASGEDGVAQFELPLAAQPRDPIPVHVSDSLVAFRRLCPELPSKALGALHEALCGESIQDAHDALADVHAMRNVMNKRLELETAESPLTLAQELQRASTPFEECARVTHAAIVAKKIDLHPVVLYVPSGLAFDDKRYIFQDRSYPYWDATTKRRYRIAS